MTARKQLRLVATTSIERGACGNVANVTIRKRVHRGVLKARAGANFTLEFNEELHGKIHNCPLASSTHDDNLKRARRAVTQRRGVERRDFRGVEPCPPR